MSKSLKCTLGLLVLSANLAFGAILTSQGAVVDTAGTGFGSFNTILAIQAQGQDDTEVGCVGRLGGEDVSGAENCATLGFAGGDEQTTGADIKTATYLIGSDFSLDDFRVVLNLNEADQDALVENLQLLVFSGNDLVFTSEAYGSEDSIFISGLEGQGQSGVIFELTGVTSEEAAAFAEGSRIGLAATISDVSAGADSFRIGFQTSDPDPGEDPVPEPATLITLGAGLVFLGLWRKRF